MTNNKQAPREVWCMVDGDHTDWVWTDKGACVRCTDEQNRLNPDGPPNVPVRYIRADVAAELARDCLRAVSTYTGHPPPNSDVVLLQRIADLESEP